MTNAWNKWGKDDEVGAPNFIGPAQTLHALSLVQDGEVLSLAQPLFPGMAMPPHRAGLMHFMDRDGGDYAAGASSPGGFKFAEDTLVMPLHTGTHVDALCHCWYGHEMYNGHPETAVRSTRKAEKLGVEKIPPIVTRGVLADVAAYVGEPLEDGFSIDEKLLRATLDAASVTLMPGDVLLLRTGWQERQGKPKTVNYNAEPGIDVSAGIWLAQSGVSMIGADNFAIEAMPFPEGKVFPVHQSLIRDYGIPLLEGLVLAPLAARKRYVFLFIAAGLPLRGATGSPLNPLVIL